jgi:hypothetical protein
MTQPDAYSRFLLTLIAAPAAIVSAVSSEPAPDLVERAWYLVSSAMRLDRRDWTRQLVGALRSSDAAERSAAEFALWRIHAEIVRDHDD